MRKCKACNLAVRLGSVFNWKAMYVILSMWSPAPWSRSCLLTRLPLTTVTLCYSAAPGLDDLRRGLQSGYQSLQPTSPSSITTSWRNTDSTTENILATRMGTLAVSTLDHYGMQWHGNSLETDLTTSVSVRHVCPQQCFSSECGTWWFSEKSWNE